MAEDISPALRDATHVSEIGFAEFTTDLILKVFNGLVAANLNQMEAYVQLVQDLGKSLKDYVNDTHDQIGPDQILAFLSATLPADANTGQPKQIKAGETLTQTEADALNTSLTLPTADGGLTGDNKVAATQALDPTGVDKILEACARRIAANKYDLLREMVKQGLLRLVVTNGLIESKLTFNTYSSNYYSANSSTYSRKAFDFNVKAKTGSALSKWFSASAAANYSQLTVQTANQSQFASSSTSVNIYGLVHLNFKTDFLPLGG